MKDKTESLRIVQTSCAWRSYSNTILKTFRMEKRLVLNTLLLKLSSCFSYKFLLSCGANVYANYSDEFFCGYVDMFRCSSASTASFIASQQLQMKAIIHSTEIPLHSTLVFSPSKILILFNNPLVSDKEISETNTSKTATSKNIARATKTWMARMVLIQKHIDLMTTPLRGRPVLLSLV